MTNLTVANTILDQLGGRRFIAMTGAKNFVGSEMSLSMTLPGSLTKGRINKLRITLTPDDLYKVEAFVFRKYELIPKGTIEGVYADSLRGVFTNMTGLDTHL